MDEDQLDLDFFKQLRAQIEHEDELIHQRITWLLTIHGFLFTAYGFSLSAQGALCTPKCAGIPIPESIREIRTTLACLALLISLVMLCGTGAAAIAILRCIRDWNDHPVRNRNNYPSIVSRGFLDAGAYAGLMPTYLLPILTAAAWYFLVSNEDAVRNISLAILAFTVIGFCFMLGVSFGSRAR